MAKLTYEEVSRLGTAVEAKARKIPLKQRVQNGVRWLDENFPGWESRINLETLDLSNGEQCICGQVFTGKKESRQRWDGKREVIETPGYSYAHNNLFSEANSWITAILGVDTISRRAKGYASPLSTLYRYRAAAVAIALGFNTDDDKDRVSYSGLQREWQRVIKARAKERASATA